MFKLKYHMQNHEIQKSLLDEMSIFDMIKRVDPEYEEYWNIYL